METPRKQFPKQLPDPEKLRCKGINSHLQLQKLTGCAMRELHGVSCYHYESVKNALYGIAGKIFTVTGYEGENNARPLAQCREGERPWQPFIIFSDVRRVNGNGNVDETRCGPAFAKFIRDNKLGKVTASSEIQSWTKNYVTMWVWEVDYEALAAAVDKWVEENNLAPEAPPSAVVAGAEPNSATTSRPAVANRNPVVEPAQGAITITMNEVCRRAR